MEPIWCGLTFAAGEGSDFSTVAILILAAIGTTGLMLALTHLLGPRRHGPVKDDIYESLKTFFSPGK